MSEPGVSDRRRSRRLTLALAIAGGLASRIVVIATALLAAHSAAPDPNPAHWNRGDTVLSPLLRWDAGYYLEIAEHGYSLTPHGGGATTLAFFPGYPLAVRAVGRACGLSAPAAAILVSHLAFFFALAVVVVTVEEQFGARVARLSAVLLAFLPWSAFASFPYSESLFLLAAAGTLAALGRGRWWLAGAFAALATLTRLVGLAVVAALAAEAWRTRSRRPKTLLAPVLGLGGISAFALFLWLRFGEPFEFARAIEQPAWKRSPLDAPLVVLLAPARSLYHLATGSGKIGDLDVWLLFGALALLWAERRRLPLSWLTYAVAGLLLPVGSGSLHSIGRYLFPLFPVTVAAALGLERRRPAAAVVAIALLAAGLILITARYARWLWES